MLTEPVQVLSVQEASQRLASVVLGLPAADTSDPTWPSVDRGK
jgi:hypothetical protein